ncbi:cobalamin transport system substrate-binding protein [Cytobacillus horneckiae]|uniref:ABC transporter substrate-binding protein n=1 Tax=Cytobacillus horneckiae TaxID=549687 RepID=UPI00082547C0|nr:ABC transporter substrate-binding protein [Cytobacillus horneckiae]MBN6884988.1 ABC transporter substrate-binding protein [Cytobacillus horneckiae]MCM3179265.1 ABC transporter substrate-binding protein [Cytobacillus horneckiae]MEC1154487.1 ABC transporter substrate-binding protein [Cytobacillus horneckiae]MED2937822.1 ABC transporter substrate-binding protein [Cytobacillus horneckiae]
MKWTKWFSAVMLFFILTACQANETKEVAEQQEDLAYSVVDDAGNEVTFEKVPEKVISLQPSNTEILFSLGSGDKVIGATEYDNYPEEAQSIERVSDSVNINAEQIIDLKPDVVFAYTIGQKEQLKPLEDSGITVFVIESALSFDDVYGDIEQIAAVMGEEEKGDEIIDGIQKQLKEVEEKIASVDEKKKVYFEISPAPDIYTTGKNTFQQEVMNKAGVENIFADMEGWIKLSEEEIIDRNPELITTTVGYVENPVEEILSRKGWNQISAVEAEEVKLLDSDIMSRPGPRIGEAVEILAEAAYPELFN